VRPRRYRAAWAAIIACGCAVAVITATPRLSPPWPGGDVTVSAVSPVAATHPSYSGFEEFFEGERPGLIAYCVAAFGLTRPAAEDIAQDAFLEVFRRWDTLTKPRAYLRQVAYHKALKRPCEQPSDEIDPGPAPGDASTGSWHLVQQALRQLPSQQRVVFALILDGHPVSDIAEVLGLTPATVRSHARHARRTLRRWHHGGQNAEGAPR